MTVGAILSVALAWADPRCGACGPEARDWLAWSGAQGDVRTAENRPEAAFHFAFDVAKSVRPLVLNKPGVVVPFKVGTSVEGRAIWGFRLREPGSPIRGKMLVFANMHALEWTPTEVALAFLEDFAGQPIPGVDLVVIPSLNVDGRDRVEHDLVASRNVYRRGNANQVDLNRDFPVHRESASLWKALIPARYSVSPAPLSQPESAALDRLAASEVFDAAVSLHSFGGFFYYPWAGRWARTEDVHEHQRLGQIMQGAMVNHPYKPRQLSRWGFVFRGLGMELDHLYGSYGAMAFLVETTRSGYERPADLGNHFRMYNPRDPQPHAREGVRYLRALASEVASGRVRARPRAK